MKRKFLVEYHVSGTMTDVIETEESHDELSERIENEVNEDDWEADLDRIDDIDFHVTEMFLIERDGKRSWTTYVRETDKRIEE